MTSSHSTHGFRWFFARPNCQPVKGFTYIELIVSLAILAILAATAMPMIELSAKRQKESELRYTLREIREAIDAYKRAYDAGNIKNTLEASGYPPTLEILVNGVVDEKDPKKTKLRFLRKIPQDPFHPNSDKPNWGIRSYASESKQPMPGNDVFDVYSLSVEIGLNGIPYAEW